MNRLARARRALILRGIRVGHLSLAARLVGRHDPFPQTALFRAVDWHISNHPAGLDRLAPLARCAPPFAARIWRAICLWDGHREQAIEALNRLGTDHHEHGFNRMGARAWAMFLALPRLGAATRDAPAPALFQFWDRDPPPDITQAMTAWRHAAGDRYAAFDHDSAAAYIGRHAGPAEARLFRAAPHPAVQSDYFRLCRLLTEGGLYVDADAQMQPDLPGVTAGFAGRTVIWLRTRAPAMSIANGFLAAPPGTRLIAEAFAEASRRLAAGTPRHVFEYAGPTLLTETALRLHAEGTLGPVVALTDDEVSHRAMTQIDAAYKRDERNWHIWQDRQDRQTPRVGLS